MKQIDGLTIGNQKCSSSNLQWLIDTGLREAQFWEAQADKSVRCRLCPRSCRIDSEGFGFCRARFNDGGALKTAIWGKLLLPGIEPIETEAVFHYWPGARILSIGNLGCNLSCDFCQNWETSDMAMISKESVHFQTPQQIIDMCKSLGIQVLSFTYNDPAVWFEFVYDTAKIAQKAGIKTVFKSAGFLSAGAIQKLIEVIDVFSLSLKTINPKTFSRMSKGVLEPVLEGIKLVHKSKRHLKVSNLIVTGVTDVLDEVRTLANWMIKEVSDDVPVHFVRFHPAYRYMNVTRTPIEFLERARQTALEIGLKYVYIGNTYEQGHADIKCKSCGNLLVERFGLHTRLTGLTQDAKCTKCGQPQNIVLQPATADSAGKVDEKSLTRTALWAWSNADARNLHLQVHNTTAENQAVVCEHIDEKGTVIKREATNFPPGAQLRWAIGQWNDQEKVVKIKYSDKLTCHLAELLDRAHFPIASVMDPNAGGSTVTMQAPKPC